MKRVWVLHNKSENKIQGIYQSNIDAVCEIVQHNNKDFQITCYELQNYQYLNIIKIIGLGVLILFLLLGFIFCVFSVPKYLEPKLEIRQNASPIGTT